MRQRTMPKTQDSRRISPKELMAEGIIKRKTLYRFTKEDIAYIIKRRKELEAEGKNDNQIAKIIAQEKHWSMGSIRQKTDQLVSEGKLLKNPNNVRPYQRKEILQIIKRRAELAAEGSNDSNIAKIIGKEKKRSPGSLWILIQRLVKENQLPKNPNNRSFFSEDEIHSIISRRNQLMKQEFTDNKISKILSCEMGGFHPPHSIVLLLNRLEKESVIIPNPNKLPPTKAFTETETQTIIRTRQKLMSKGAKDKKISKELSKRLKRSAGSVLAYIRKLIERKILDENPNKQKGYSKKNLEEIGEIRAKLMSKGFGEKEVSEELGRILERNWRCIREKIRKMVKSGELPENQNGQKHDPSETELISGLAQAADAMEKFGGEGR